MKNYFSKIILTAILCGLSFLAYGCEGDSDMLMIDTENTQAVSEKQNFQTEVTRNNNINNTHNTNSEVDEIYEQVYNQLITFNNTIEFDKFIEKDIINQVAERIFTNTPDIFWTDGYSWSTDYSSTTIKFNISSDISSEKIPYMYEEMCIAADNIISGIPSGSNEYEKALFVHDSIVNNTDYDFNGLNSSENGIFGTSYGCLVNKLAVCQGYAEAFKFIMNHIGIECGVVSGMTERGSHAWNYINIDGEYYWVDATWDDPSSEGEENNTLRHNYFLLDDRFMKNRTADDANEFIPVCFSMRYNYFVYNGCYIENYNFDDVNRIISSYNGRVEIMFSSETEAEKCIDDLFNNNMIWNIDCFDSWSGTLWHSYDEKTYVLSIETE